MADAQCLRELVERHDCGVPLALLKAAEILLGEAGNLGDLLLGQAPLSTDTGEISPYELAHIHAEPVAIGSEKCYQLKYV